MWKSFWHNCGPMLLVVVCALWSVRAFLNCLDCFANFGQDGYLIGWILDQAGKNLYGLHLGGWQQIFGGNIFYPETQVLLYSDLFIVTSLLTYYWGRLVNNPMILTGLAIVGGQVLVMGISYIWWKKMCGKKWIAALAAIAFGLSQVRMHYQVHLQMWNMQYWLLGCYLIWMWGQNKHRNMWLIAGLSLIGLQAWESVLPVYFAMLMVGVMLWSGEVRKHWKTVFVGIVVMGVIAMIPLFGYWQVSNTYNFQRTIRDAAAGGMSIDDLWGKFFSPGLLILALITGVSGWKMRGTIGKLKEMKWLVVVSAISLLLAMGPVLKWGGKTVKFNGWAIPLPYAATYYVVPGMEAFRTPSRWIWVAVWSGTALGTIILANVKNKRYIYLLMLLSLFLGSSINSVRRFPMRKDVPEVYKWLTGQPDGVVVNYPMIVGEDAAVEMSYSIYHKKTLVEGFSGFAPPQILLIRNEVNEASDSGKLLEISKRVGATYLITNKREINNDVNKIVYEDDMNRVYKL